MIALLVVAAEAAEYRQIEVADGRVLQGEVVETGEQGLTLRLAQGLADVPFADIARLDPVAGELVAALPPLRVLVLPTSGADPASEDLADRQLRAAFGAVPATRALLLDDLPQTVPAATRDALRRCTLDATCVVSAATDVPVDVVVMPVLHVTTGAEELVLASVWLDAPRAQRRLALTHPPGPEARAADLGEATYLLLALRSAAPEGPSAVANAARLVAPTQGAAAPTVAPAPVPSPPPAAAPKPVDLDALAFVPVPGITAFSSGRPGAGVAAAAVVLPATVALVYVAGHESARAGTVVAISAIGYYSMCVVANRIVSPVMITPTDGGAMLTVGGSL